MALYMVGTSNLGSWNSHWIKSTTQLGVHGGHTSTMIRPLCKCVVVFRPYIFRHTWFMAFCRWLRQCFAGLGWLWARLKYQCITMYKCIQFRIVYLIIWGFLAWVTPDTIGFHTKHDQFHQSPISMDFFNGFLSAGNPWFHVFFHPSNIDVSYFPINQFWHGCCSRFSWWGKFGRFWPRLSFHERIWGLDDWHLLPSSLGDWPFTEWNDHQKCVDDEQLSCTFLMYVYIYNSHPLLYIITD